MFTFLRRIYIYILIQFLIRRKLYEKAENFARRYLNCKGNEILGHYFLAQIYKSQGNINEAIAEYEFIFQKNGASVGDYFDLIPLHFQNKNYRRVISLSAVLLEKGHNKIEGIVLDPFMDDFNTYIGMAYYHLGEIEKGKNFLKKIKSREIRDKYLKPIEEQKES